MVLVNKVVTRQKSPLNCFGICLTYELVTVGYINTVVNGTSVQWYNCRCLNYFKFRPEDIHDGCMQNWYPGIIILLFPRYLLNTFTIAHIYLFR